MTAQLSLLVDVEPHERPRKRVRQVSVSAYAELRDSGRLSKRTADVFRELAAYYNRKADWPTVHELARWMFEHGDLPRLDARLIAPRMCELSKGIQNRTTKVFHGGGLIDALPARPCAVAKTKAHPWRIVSR